VCFANTHPLNNDLSGGYRYTPFEKLAPVLQLSPCYFKFFSPEINGKNPFRGLDQKKLLKMGILRMPKQVAMKCMKFWHDGNFTRIFKNTKAEP